ncbi:putative poly(ADP-ribose) polymerase, catalytic domain-containing protein [Medicago truncatula]|uniref:Putative poly(ADP-ribose) polymerase, catalytic domain-containing protein n=1 Tax=Medicago truncatula TaxID=3880 RepID=A0A396GZM7_MEDTR|nr:putative poly(ADP-ribose) polymerase, catalytic domain-containing protein [Medicago truncatula]
MEENPSKALDGVSLNKKRKRDSQGVSRRTGVLAPTSVVVKQMTLARDICKPDDSCPDISKSLVSYYLNYKKSGIPKRLMFYKNGKWVDYPEDVVDLVKKDFKIKKAIVEVELNGQEVVLDFLHMNHVDMKTCLQQPIGWIDEEGNYFFPKVFVGSTEEPNNIREREGEERLNKKEPHEIKLHISNEINGADESKLRKYSRESDNATKNVKAEGHAMTTKIGIQNVAIDINQEPDIDLNDYSESLYGKLDVNSTQKMFLKGMSSLGISESDIVGIYRSSGRSMQMRLQLFEKQADIIKGIRGVANIRYAWLACSKEEISTMMEYELSHYELSPSKCIYGPGVHLAAITHPFVCSLSCDEDGNGIKHMFLCRVIMGNMELLRPSSKQLRPSDCEYDNGVDDIQCPKCYVVWNMNMNTHIYPEFVVSFKSPLGFEGNVPLEKKLCRVSVLDIYFCIKTFFTFCYYIIITDA